MSLATKTAIAAEATMPNSQNHHYNKHKYNIIINIIYAISLELDITGTPGPDDKISSSMVPSV